MQTLDEDLVRLYLSDIGAHPLLTKDKEVSLAQAAEAGRQASAELVSTANCSATRVRELRRIVNTGQAAAEEFTNGNLRLVVSIARKYRGSDMPLLDLVQEGNLGLMHAVDKFDWRKGFKFSTYATWWIRQAINRGIANGGRSIRLPVHAGDLLNQVSRARARLEVQHGRRATIGELAADLGVGADKITEILKHAAPTISLSEPWGQEGDAEVGDFLEDRGAVSPVDAAAQAILSVEVAALLTGLDPREREIIQLRFGLDRGEPHTLEQVGARFGVSRERIRQIEVQAMAKLRELTAFEDRYI